MKVLAFAASNSRQSINRTLAAYAAGLIDNATVEVLDINDYEMPIYSEDREKELGQPEQARNFFKKIGEADAIVVSYAEHNGSYTAAANVLAAATASAPHFAAEVRASISVPSFYANFDLDSNQFTNARIKREIERAVQLLQA